MAKGGAKFENCPNSCSILGYFSNYDWELVKNIALNIFKKSANLVTMLLIPKMMICLPNINEIK